MRQINQHLHAPLLASHITAIERIQIGSARCLLIKDIFFPVCDYPGNVDLNKSY